MIRGCCCNGGAADPCISGAGSHVVLSNQLRWVEGYQRWEGGVGVCESECDTTVPDAPDFSVEYGDCETYENIDCCTADGYATSKEWRLKRSVDMPSAWTATLPWVGESSLSGSAKWSWGGNATQFLAPYSQRVDTWSDTVDGISRTNTGECCQCAIYSGTGDPFVATVQFRSWPEYTSGPVVMLIRRQAPTAARHWLISGGYFQITDSTGTVLWQTALTGNISALISAVDGQTAAPVVASWPFIGSPTSETSSTPVSMFAEGMTGPIDTTDSDVRLFELSSWQAVPDLDVQESSLCESIGWEADVPNFTAGDGYIGSCGGDIPCTVTRYKAICAGVQFRGADSDFCRNNSDCSLLLNTNDCLGDDAPNHPYATTTWEPNCVGSDGDYVWSPCGPCAPGGDGGTGPQGCGPAGGNQPIVGPFLCSDQDENEYGGSGVDVGFCCEVVCYGWKVVERWAAKLSVHTTITRTA